MTHVLRLLIAFSLVVAGAGLAWLGGVLAYVEIMRGRFSH